MKKVLLLLCVALVSVATTFFLLSGCATRPRGYPAREGINNFDRVNDRLYRGAQPNNLGILALQRLGVKTIINLRKEADVWPAEAGVARAAGMVYTNIPMSGTWPPKEDQVLRALAVIESSPDPVFVHCRHGCDRTGAVIACYRIKHDQWTVDQALREAKQYDMAAWSFALKNYVKNFAREREQPKPAQP